MSATAARAEYIKAGFRTVDAGPDSSVLAKYADAARKTTEPVPTFFEIEADAQAICDERMALLSNDMRRFNHSIAGENIGLDLDYSQSTPKIDVIDVRRDANHQAVAAEITIDFSKQQTSITTWGPAFSAPYGFVFLIDADGNFLTDDSGVFLMEEI
jgi:hypothetical protein